MSEQCERIDVWLHTAADSTENDIPPEDLAAHVAACPRCRLALITLLADRIAPSARPADQPCAMIEAQLPAFVDYERAHGLVAAARVFPDVWWHTLVCPCCDDLYRTLHELAAVPAESPGSAASEPAAMPAEPPAGAASQTRQRATIDAQIQLHPGVVHQLLSAQRRLGAHWGEQQSDVIIAEQFGEIGLIQVSLRHEPLAKLALVVRTNPPIEGVVTLALDGTSYAETTDPHGCAVFSGLDAALFSRGDGQQINLKIRLPES